MTEVSTATDESDSRRDPSTSQLNSPRLLTGGWGKNALGIFYIFICPGPIGSRLTCARSASSPDVDHKDGSDDRTQPGTPTLPAKSRTAPISVSVPGPGPGQPVDPAENAAIDPLSHVCAQ
jgi:hypothetical protein